MQRYKKSLYKNSTFEIEFFALKHKLKTLSHRFSFSENHNC